MSFYIFKAQHLNEVQVTVTLGILVSSDQSQPSLTLNIYLKLLAAKQLFNNNEK